ncbi:alpha-E domain-containing protein [Desulfovibrio inopinatus]|uniref:alpha-E domain-containing protein n=1 Tax=Desulfovibrio inopinatus TaxID=102109 RepID=UPI000427344E|nr:alpha-E domain-containing protein [Desulfovibrio inopinatus]
MLSRVADAVYWMSRYLERAFNQARFIDVNWLLTLDTPDHYGEQWEPLVSTTGDSELFYKLYERASRKNVIQFMTFDLNYTNSIRSCMRYARENARTIREMIPTEMWEEINILYHFVERAATRSDEVVNNPFAFCSEVKRRGFVLGGITSSSMARDEVFNFLNMGRMLERADKTSRLVDVKYFLLLPSAQDVNTTLDHIQWSALLKAASAFQAYRHLYGPIQPERVVELLLFDHEFPRGVLHCLGEAQHCLHEITGTRVGHFSNEAEKKLGLLVAELSFHSALEVIADGLHEFTDNLQKRMNNIDAAISDTFFSPSPLLDSSQEQ